MSENNIIPITNYADLDKALKETEETLKNKVTETYWLRYVFRRFPLYSAIGLIFFAVCLAMAMIDKIGFNMIDQFLKQAISFTFRCDVPILIVSFSVLSVLLVLASMLGKKLRDKETKALNPWVKIFTNILLLAMLLGGVSAVITSQYPLQLGLAAFSVVTLFAMLIDRTLGYTRRNERYQLFAGRAKGLRILFASRDKLGISFAESHLLEFAKFYEELRLSKHNDTISDSHYLLTQFEQLKGAPK